MEKWLDAIQSMSARELEGLTDRTLDLLVLIKAYFSTRYPAAHDAWWQNVERRFAHLSEKSPAAAPPQRKPS